MFHLVRWAALGVLAASLFIVVMDLTVLNIAIPKLTADLQPDSVQFLWIIDSYGLVVLRPRRSTFGR